MSEPIETEQEVSPAGATAEVEEQQQPEPPQPVGPSERPASAAHTGHASSELAESEQQMLAAEGPASATVVEGVDAVDSSEDARDEEEDDTGEDEPQLVEADDDLPQREQPTEADDGNAADDTAESEQRMTEAEKEIERYNELVKRAGEQQLTLQTGDEESDGSGADTARFTANDLPAAATTSLASPSSALQTVAIDTTAAFVSASHTPHSPRYPLLTSPAAAAVDDASSPPSPSSPSSTSPAVRSWSDVEAAKAECEHLLHINKTRQRHIALILDAERRQNHPSLAVAAAAAQQSQSADSGANEPIKTDYIKLLTQLASIWDDVLQQQSRSETAIARLLDKLNEQDRLGEEMQDSLRSFVIEMARNATDKRGNTAPISRYERLLQDEAKVSRQLADVRLLYLQQQGQMDSIQHDIKQKEELAEGLHLIDFEQLKIENATLHEKIEERNDEIYKLTRKKHSCIEVLTHVREKVWDVWRDNRQLRDALQHMDDDILERRTVLKRSKQQREQLRRHNALLKTKEGFVGVDALVMDFEKRKELLAALRERIEVKRVRWEQLTRAKEKRAGASGLGQQERHKLKLSRATDESESKEQTDLWAQTRGAHMPSR